MRAMTTLAAELRSLWLRNGDDSMSEPCRAAPLAVVCACLTRPLCEGFWSLLPQIGANQRTLLAVLYYYMSQRTAGSTPAAVAAAQVYVLLLRLPGSVSFKIFQPMLVRYAVDLLQRWPALPSRTVGRSGGRQSVQDMDTAMDVDEEHEASVDATVLMTLLKCAACAANRTFAPAPADGLPG